MNKEHNSIANFFTTAFVALIVVFALCFTSELMLLFKCEYEVTNSRLKTANLVKFATIEELEKALLANPQNYYINLKLANMYEGLGKYDTANKMYNEALKKSGRTNYTLYKYAVFCAKQNLFVLSTSMAEEIISNSANNVKYKALIYEAVGDSMMKQNEYSGATKAYQIASKYAKSLKNKDLFTSLKGKHAYSYAKLADYYIENKKVDDAICALNNSIKIKETNIALYKLALIYMHYDKIKAQSLMEKAFMNDPYIVNPYIYNELLNDLIQSAQDDSNQSSVNYYSVKLNRFKTIMREVYIYKQDILVDNSEIIKEKKDYYLKFDIQNNTKEKIDQLFFDIEIILNLHKYKISKKIVYLSSVLMPQEHVPGIKVKLPQNLDIVDIKDHNYLILKYYAKKRSKAPTTLIKIESANF